MIRSQRYRATSQWFTWEDLDFPNPGVERRIAANAAASSVAGVEFVVLFGFHFRWDFVSCFDVVHKLIAFTVAEYHKYGIKVIDHHSAVLTYRPRTWEDRVANFSKNHHHVPMTPDPGFIECLSYEGSRLNDWREIRTDTGRPVYLEAYHAEVFCTRNEHFRKAYLSYVKRLVAETGVDGLMCDDVGHYGHWGSCGCPFCRAEFRRRSGAELPPPDDWSFWGDYGNPLFRSWVWQRHQDGRDFLECVRQALGPDKLLTSCCSSSMGKYNDPGALDMAHWNASLNLVMLEMCGSVTGGMEAMESRIPDILLNQGIAQRRDLSCLGLGYAYYPDEGFLVWSLNRFFNSDIWISTHKTRLGITVEEQRKMPDEPEIVREAYSFEASHSELFALEDTAKVAVYYSPAARSFQGDSPEDYSLPLKNVIVALFRADIPCTVTTVIPESSTPKVLLLSDCDVLSREEQAALDRYRADGGVVVALGMLGNLDESGAPSSTPYLERYGIRQKPMQVPRGVLPKERASFFQPWGWTPERDEPGQVEFSCENGLEKTDFPEFFLLDRNFFWTPCRALCMEKLASLMPMIRSLAPRDLDVECPDEVRYHVYRDAKGAFVVHFLPTDISAEYHETLRFQGKGAPIVRKLRYKPLAGIVRIKGVYGQAMLYSADLSAPRKGVVQKGETFFNLTGLSRFFTIKLA
ncbi:MAG: hypothetical protein MJ202_02740 [Lentisphaeria bacterium]|nr:hypothetical protein [Lentisphaeria bacterium]